MTTSAWPIVVPARLERGVIRMNAKRLAELLKGKRDCGLTVTIERQHATRSAAQNAWYWSGILVGLSERTGCTVDEMHEYCKRRFNAKRLILTNEHGEIVDEDRIGQTTTRLNKVTFGEYCEAIREWAARDLGVVIDDPDQHWRDKPREVRM